MTILRSFIDNPEDINEHITEHINSIIIHLLTNNNRVRDFKLLLLTKKRVNHRRALSCNNALRSRVNGLQIDVKGIIMSDKVDI